MSEEEHSLLGPSSLERRWLCPGSLEQERRTPDSESKFSREGDLAHSLMAEWLNGGRTLTEAKIAAGDDYRDAIQNCAQFVAYLRQRSEGYDEIIEDKIDLTEVHPEIGFGTIDLGTIKPFEEAHIVDWKFGGSQVTPAERNLQAAAYALGVADNYCVPTVRVSIMMAQTDFETSYTYHESDWENVRAALRNIAERALKPCAPLIPSKDACKFCNARFGQCSALRDKVGAIKPIEDLSNLSVDDLKRELESSELAKMYHGGLAQRAYQIIEQGGVVPGYNLVEGRGTRKFSDDLTEEKLKEIGAQLNKPVDELMTEPVIKSPAKMDKLWGKAKKVTEALAGWIDKKPGKLALKKEA